MATNSKKDDHLFKPDRRGAERPDTFDRRKIARPSGRLIARGFLFAAAVLILISLAIRYHR